MEAVIITIGDEILIGQVIDSNSSFIAENLNMAGINVSQILSVPDRSSSIKQAIDQGFTQAGLIIMTGGLGPTRDDITKQTLAEYFNTHLARNSEVLKHNISFLRAREVKITERNRKQADLPEDCTIIENDFGTAAGMWFKEEKRSLIAMPGVPFEMKEMLVNKILPQLKKQSGLPPIFHRTILTTGISESEISEKTASFEDELPSHIKLAYLPSPGLLRLRLTAFSADNISALDDLNIFIEKLVRIIPEYVYGFDKDRLEILIGKMLHDSKKTLAVAESCTGGSIAQKITSIPGASGYFTGSVTAYGNSIKKDILHVNKSTLDKHGAVSEAVVIEMAKGIKNLFKTDYALATSGIAGPEGGTPEKPVGLTWIALATDGGTYTKRLQLGEHRERNIEKASKAALFMLWKKLVRLSSQ